MADLLLVNNIVLGIAVIIIVALLSWAMIAEKKLSKYEDSWFWRKRK